MKRLLVITVALFTFSLAACSGEPSQSQVEAALQKNIAQGNEAAKQFAGNAMTPDMQTKLNSAKKIACTKENDQAYKCDVEIDVKSPLGAFKRMIPVRLVKGSDGWVVVSQ